MRVGIKDIAKIVNLHPSTVGDILRNRPQCYASEKVKKRVFEVAKSLNYYPNLAARTLKTKRSNLVGLIANATWEPHLAKLTPMISTKLIKHKMTLEVHLLGNIIEDEENSLRAAHARPVDAIIEIAHYYPRKDSYVNYLLQMNFPLVCVLAQTDINAHCVTIDRKDAMFKVVEYLIGLGHRRIACCSYHLPRDNEERDKKRSGFIHAMKHFGLDVPREYLFDVSGTFKDGYEFGRKIRTGKEYPTAYFMHNDAAAIGFIRALTDRKIRVPEDVSVVGFNGDDESEFYVPRLTTVQIPISEVAKHTVELITTLISNPSDRNGEDGYHKIILPTKLLVRESCAIPAC